MEQVTNEYGRKMAVALRAVRQMHSDCSRLLQDCDGAVGQGRVSIFKNAVTTDLTWSFSATQWMAEGVYRYYDASDVRLGLVEGVMACFMDRGSPEVPAEPLFLTGRLQYVVDTEDGAHEACKEWDLWNTFLIWNTGLPMGKVLTPSVPEPERIKSAIMIGVPLYSIASIEVVTELMNRVRDHRP